MLVPILITIAAVLIVVAIIWAIVAFKAMKTQKDIMSNMNKNWDRFDRHE